MVIVVLVAAVVWLAVVVGASMVAVDIACTVASLSVWYLHCVIAVVVEVVVELVADVFVVIAVVVATVMLLV